MWGSIPALLCPTRDLSLPSLPSLQAGRVVLTAGQIGLQPATMMLAPPTHQASLSLSHVCSVMEANHTSLHCTLCGLCYYTSEEAGWSARATWRKVRGTQGKRSLYVNPAPSSLSHPLPSSSSFPSGIHSSHLCSSSEFLLCHVGPAWNGVSHPSPLTAS